MLKSSIFSFNFLRFVQSGLYIDFFFKKIIEIFVRNFLIYASIFFGEKYMIEVLTKKIIDSTIFSVNKKFSLMDLFYSYYFIQLVGLFIYFITLINLIILLF